MITKDRIPYETILRAQEQDETAIMEILMRYRNYIRKLSFCEVKEENGQSYYCPDEDMVLQLEVKLMTSIPKFKILPYQETSV